MNLITPSFGLIFWQTIIFFLMFFIIAKFAWKPIIYFIENREKYIKKSLDNAKKVRNEIYHLQYYKEQWIKESNLQRYIILKELNKINNIIRLETIQKDKSDKKKMILQSKYLLEKEKKDVRYHIKNYISHIAIAIAEKIIIKELKKNKEQERILINLITVNAINQIEFSF